MFKLLNLGFSKVDGFTYYHYELKVSIKVIDNDHFMVLDDDVTKNITVTYEQLEEMLVSIYE